MKPRVGSITMILFLIGAWCALWGSVTPANLLGGLAVGVISTAFFGPNSLTSSVSLPHLVQLLLLIGRDLVASTVSVAREVLTPTDYTDERFLDVTVKPGVEPHLLLLTVAITLTPGTAVVDVDRETATLRLHLLYADRSDETIELVHKLGELAMKALPQLEMAS